MEKQSTINLLRKQIEEGDTLFLQGAEPSSRTARIVTKRFLLRLAIQKWPLPRRDLYYSVHYRELYYAENKQDWLALLKHCAYPQQKLLDLLQRHRRINWVRVMLELNKDLQLSSGYIRYVLKASPMQFEHCLPYIHTTEVSTLQQIAIKARSAHAWKWMTQSPLFNKKDMLIALCTYHKEKVQHLSLEGQQQYWEPSKLITFNVMAELCFVENLDLSSEVLAVFPNVLVGRDQYAGSWVSGKVHRTEYIKKNTHQTLHDLVPKPYYLFRVPYTRPDTAIVWYPHVDIGANCALAAYLATGFGEKYFTTQFLEDYKKEIITEFQKNNPYIETVRWFLHDYCWQNLYRYLYYLDILPVELRALIANAMW